MFVGCTSKQPSLPNNGHEMDNLIGNNQEENGIDSSADIGPISGANSIYFDFDKYEIRGDMWQKIKTNMTAFEGKNIRLEGNCDEFGSDEYNNALGLKRAAAVKAALINFGFPEKLINMASLGEMNPACKEKTEECWSKNRRVDFTESKLQK
jgi:peptidoglycan-associated lipoprotein